MESKPISREILAICCLLFVWACLLDVESASGQSKMSPAQEILEAAGEIRDQGLKKIHDALEHNRKTMHAKQYDQWYVCSHVEIYKNIVTMLDAKKPEFLAYCKEKMGQNCEQDMEMKYEFYKNEYKTYIDQCKSSRSTAQPSPGSPSTPPGRNTMTFHD